jgi:hypothetical protein
MPNTAPAVTMATRTPIGLIAPDIGSRPARAASIRGLVILGGILGRAPRAQGAARSLRGCLPDAAYTIGNSMDKNRK